MPLSPPPIQRMQFCSAEAYRRFTPFMWRTGRLIEPRFDFMLNLFVTDHIGTLFRPYWPRPQGEHLME